MKNLLNHIDTENGMVTLILSDYGYNMKSKNKINRHRTIRKNNSENEF